MSRLAPATGHRERRAADRLGRPRRLIDSVFGDPGFSYYAAVVYLILGTAFFLDQDVAARTAVGQALHPYDAIWTALELVGAGMIIASVFGRRSRHALEAAGLVLMLFSWGMQFIAALSVQGAGDLRSWVFAPILTAGTLRYRRLLQLR